MNLLNPAIRHIAETAKIPSFSSYEERLHPYVLQIFQDIDKTERLNVPGNNLVFRIPGKNSARTIAVAAHLDKINHYGKEHPSSLPVVITGHYVEGAMDDCAGLGILLAVAQAASTVSFPGLLFFFSEMEESKGLKEHPELLKNNAEGYSSGMGARRIAKSCIDQQLIPDEIITIDTTPIFKKDPGVALYSEHWEYNGLKPSEELVKKTTSAVERFKSIHADIKLSNGTNDYLHYGQLFNASENHCTVSVALEPAIYPYHQKGERVHTENINQVLQTLVQYLKLSGHSHF